MIDSRRVYDALAEKILQGYIVTDKDIKRVFNYEGRPSKKAISKALNLRTGGLVATSWYQGSELPSGLYLDIPGKIVYFWMLNPGFGFSDWTVCEYGPLEESDLKRIEETLTKKGWIETKSWFPTVGTWTRIATDTGLVLVWTEPSRPSGDIELDWAAIRQEKFNECYQAWKKMDSAVFQELQERLGYPIATDHQAMGKAKCTGN